jgi:hypothetical protein
VTQRDKRRVYIGLAAICLGLFVIGLVYGYRGRHNTICKDGKPPVYQREDAMGQVQFICHNGKTVTNG